jgi:hypothetical protein
MKKHFICLCRAYPFPHEFLSGKCDGEEVVEEAFNSGSFCSECKFSYHDGCSGRRYCKILYDQEAGPDSCPAIPLLLKEKK